MVKNIRDIIIFLLSATFVFVADIAFSQTADETVVLNSVHSYTSTGGAGWTYNWTLTDPDDISITLSSTENLTLSQTEDITFTKLGFYILRLQAIDNLGCLSEVYSKNIEVVPISNEAPVAVDDSYTTPMGVAISANLLDNDSDPDGDDLIATVLLETTVNGTMEINADGSFIYTPNPTFTGTEIFTYEVCDDAGFSLCDEGLVTIVVSANQKPIAVDDVYNETENNQIIGNVLDNDSDPEDGVLGVSFVSVVQGPDGILNMDTDGSFTFTPPNGFIGTIIYDYEVCDDALTPLCDQGTITFNYSGNIGPNAINDAFTTNQDTPITENLMNNDSDEDGDGLVVTPQATTTPNGSVVIQSNGAFTYTPNSGFYGDDTFNYELCDDGIPSKCDVATVTITVLEIIAFNREAINDIGFVFEGASASGQVLDNDILFDGTGITVGIPSGSDVINGNLLMNNDGSYQYQPNPGFSGVDNFYYEACASEIPIGCDTANVTIRVLPTEIISLGVVLTDDEVETAVNIPVTGNVLSNDFSPVDDELLINRNPLQGPEDGQLVLNDDGSFLYTPDAGFIGEDYFVYEVCGLITGDCQTARVTIRVNAETEARIFAVDDVNQLFSNETGTGNLLDNDIVPDGKTLILNTTPVSQPSMGSVSISSNGSYEYTPTSTALPFVDQFVYEVCDQDGYCSRATVFLIVSEEPEQFADVSVTKTGPAESLPDEIIQYEITVSNSGNLVAENVLLDDFLPPYILNPQYTINGSGSAIDWPGQINLGSLADGESVVINISGVIANNAPDTLENITSVISDQYDPNLENNVSIVQTKVSRAPIVIVENGFHQIIGCCYDSGLQLDASPSIGVEPLSFLWEPATNLDDPNSATPLFTGTETIEYTLTVTANNGESSSENVLIEVASCPEIITNNQVFVSSPNEMIMLDASASTGTGLSYLWWTAANEVIISGETTSNPVVSGLGKYYLQITDSLGCTDMDSVIVGLLVQIQAVADSLEMLVNTSVDINVISNDLPRDGVDPASLAILTPPDHGVAVIVADSIITYTPDPYYVGRDDFIYAVCDYFSNCDEATVLVIINDEALFVPNAFSPNGDGYNDLYVIRGIAQYEGVSLKIFNRWGNQVYEDNNYGVGAGKNGFWDGIANKGLLSGNGQVPTGTYFYILDLGNGNEKLSGFIYIDR